MRRRALLLGFFAVSSQVLVLRELVGSFGGNELLIGIGMTGWLLATSAGALLGGHSVLKLRSGLLFAVGILLLPLTLVAVRLSPAWLTTIAVEQVPFYQAALVSFSAPAPVALVSGLLFSVIAREGWRPVDSIVKVYLYEGIGSFVGGITTAFIVGSILSGPMMAIAAGAVVIISLVSGRSGKTAWTGAVLCLTVLLVLLLGGDQTGLNRALDRIRYTPYEVPASFDTHYGHQTILSHEGSYVLMTDGRTEAIFPDRESAEKILVLPMLQHRNVKELLYMGRGEFGLTQLADRFDSITVSTVDPRHELTGSIDLIIEFNGGVVRYDATLNHQIRSGSFANRFDAVVLAPGAIDNYQTARYFSLPHLLRVRRVLNDHGILLMLLPYDTERYVTDEAASLLAPIRRQVSMVFQSVSMWPGTDTWLLASNAPLTEDLDSLAVRLDGLPLSPQFVREDILVERLDPMRRERLDQALDNADDRHSIERPRLVTAQLLADARADGSRDIAGFLVDNSVWPGGVALAIVTFMLWPLYGKRPRAPRYGLVLLFVAGFVSLALELTAFYLLQSSVGYLYSDLAIMVGVFMLGLALGAAAAGSSSSTALEYPSLLILIIAAPALWLTYDLIDQKLLLVFYSLFLLVTALATGSLFVAASRRYFEDAVLCNRGVSYTVELLGSALAGLTVLPVLIPLIGVDALLLSITAMLVIAFGGAARTAYN